MEDLFKQPLDYEAVVRLPEEDTVKLDRATVVLTDDGADVFIGVKALYRKMVTKEDRIYASMDIVGDYCKVNKDITVGEFFEKLKEKIACVAEMVKCAEKGACSQEQIN